MHQNNLSLGLETVEEIKHPIQLPVNGTLPSYLTAKTLYRVGPGRYDVTHSDGKPYKINHWFDGLSLLHAFEIDSDSNTVSYRNRFLVDDLVSAVEQTPSSAWNSFSFGTFDACRSTLGRLFTMLVPTKAPTHRLNIGVTVQDIPGKGVAVRSDMAYNNLIDETTLEIDEFFGFSNLDHQLKGTFAAAHGHYDPKTNEFFNYTYDLSGPGKVTYNVFKIDSGGKTKVLAQIKHEPVYIHRAPWHPTT